jgi:hypothetical protein
MDNVVLGHLHYFYVSLSAVFRAIITWVGTGQLEGRWCLLTVSKKALGKYARKQFLNTTTFFVEQ